MRTLLLMAIALSAASAGFAQNLRITATSTDNVQVVTDGTVVPVSSDGRDATLNLTLSNIGSSSILVSSVTVSGTDFTLAAAAAPAILAPGSSATAVIRYRPVSGRASTGQVTISSTEGNVSRSTSFSLSGVLPDYSYSVVTADGRRTTITPGTKISFGASRPGTPQVLNIAIANRSTVAGTLSGVTVSGRDFVAPTAPLTIGKGQEVTIPVTFTPSVRGLVSGGIALDLGVLSSSFPLEGTGAAPDFLLVYALRSNSNTRSLIDGGQIIFDPTSALSTGTADITIANQGNGPGVVRSVTLTGSAFQLASLPLIPATLDSGQAIRFQLVFNPRQLGSYTGSLRIELEDRIVNVTVSGTTADPDFQVSYVDPGSRNTLPLSAGSTLAFPATTLTGSSTYTVVLRNQGNGTGFVTGVSVSGDSFQVADLPLLPASVNSSNEFRFTARFAPKQRGPQTGFLRVDYSGGALVIPLSGSGIAPDLTYEVEVDGGTAPLPAGSELPAFTATVGQTSSRSVRVTNSGNTDAQITAAVVTGTGFQISNLPVLPLTIAPGASQVFSVTFTPTQPGTSRGRLRVGDQNFDLTGTGLGSRLEYLYSNDAGSTPVAENGTILLAPARVGETARVGFMIQNTGTAPATLSTLDVISTGSIFTLENVPGLPARIQPGESVPVTIRFAPNNVGPLTGSLRVNTASFTLSAAGRQPVPLPDLTLNGPSGTQTPLQQPAVSLTLASPYGLPLRGTLNLSFLSDVFAENPAVQFATGGRTASFTIPENSTRAIFDNGATELKLQTGTVAGTIQIRPTFTTVAGLDVTPANTPTLSMTIARSVPQLTSVELVGRTNNTLTVQISGYSTTRNLRLVEMQLTPRGDARLSNTTITLNVESTAFSWFQSSAATPFGGLFSITVPLTFQNGSSTDDLAGRIESISTTVSNELGRSNGAKLTP